MRMYGSQPLHVGMEGCLTTSEAHDHPDTLPAFPATFFHPYPWVPHIVQYSSELRRMHWSAVRYQVSNHGSICAASFSTRVSEIELCYRHSVHVALFATAHNGSILRKVGGGEEPDRAFKIEQQRSSTLSTTTRIVRD